MPPLCPESFVQYALVLIELDNLSAEDAEDAE